MKLFTSDETWVSRHCPVRGPRRFWLGAILLLMVAVAVGAWAELKTPELPEDLKYRYMKHAFLNAEIQRQFTASLTANQRAMTDKLTELANALMSDNSEMALKCGDKYALDRNGETGEPLCKLKEIPKVAKK